MVGAAKSKELLVSCSKSDIKMQGRLQVSLFRLVCQVAVHFFWSRGKPRLVESDDVCTLVGACRPAVCDVRVHAYPPSSSKNCHSTLTCFLTPTLLPRSSLDSFKQVRRCCVLFEWLMWPRLCHNTCPKCCNAVALFLSGTRLFVGNRRMGTHLPGAHPDSGGVHPTAGACRTARLRRD